MNYGLYRKSRMLASMVVVALSSLSACTSVDSALDTTTTVKYTNNQSVAVLRSPEGLVAPEYDTRFALPEGGATTNQSSAVDIRPPDLIK